jgi:hypothetical protein
MQPLRRLSLECRLLLTLCLADLLWTLYVLHTGQATELNPLLAGALHRSLFAFILAKCAASLIPILLLEILPRKKFVVLVQRFGVLMYLVIQVGGGFFYSLV